MRMDTPAIVNLARQWAVQVGVVDRAGQAVANSQGVQARAIAVEEELRAKLLDEVGAAGCAIDVAGYRVTCAPGGVLERVKL